MLFQNFYFFVKCNFLDELRKFLDELVGRAPEQCITLLSFFKEQTRFDLCETGSFFAMLVALSERVLRVRDRKLS